MNIDLNGKTVLLGITGSISAYKGCEIARLFVKSGASVHVVMTPSAQRFVSALTFEALTRNKVLCEETESWASELNHIDIGKRASVFLIAPATANTINKISKGIADNILLQSALAYKGPLVIAAAANTQMLANNYTDGSLKMLKVNDIKIVEPQKKLLACGENGNGALREPIEIYYQTCQTLLEDDFWRDRKVVVTGGGTREKIDDVRYLSNYSSGKMAKSLATALYLKGADVCYISTMPHDDLPEEIYTIDVESAEELAAYTIDAVRVSKKGKMRKASMNSTEPMGLIQKTPYLYMVAAVSDFKPKYPQSGKLKKSTIGREWSLELTQNDDILTSINKNGIITVGFKAEMNANSGLDNAISLIADKEVDAVCYNLLSDSDSFGTTDNKIDFITSKTRVELSRDEKISLSFKILEQSKLLDNNDKEIGDV